MEIVSLVEAVGALSWALVLKNKPSVSISIELENETIALEFKCTNPEDLAKLRNYMTGKP